MTTDDDDAWFAPKRFGFGAGLPVAWQGWVLTIGYMVFSTAAAVVLAQSPFALVAVLLVSTAAFMSVAARKTRGGWTWRNGRDD